MSEHNEECNSSDKVTQLQKEHAEIYSSSNLNESDPYNQVTTPLARVDLELINSMEEPNNNR